MILTALVEALDDIPSARRREAVEHALNALSSNPVNESEMQQRIKKINAAMAIPVAEPRRTKIRRVPKDPSARPLTQREVREVVEGAKEDRPTQERPRSFATALKQGTQGAPKKATKAGMTRRGALTTQQVEVYWTLQQLAEERKIQTQLARLWLLKAGIEKPASGRWQWREGSRELKRVRKALGLV